MVVEIMPTPGHHPSPEALDTLMARASERCNKPGGIELQVDEEIAVAEQVGPSKRWTYQELVTFEGTHAKLQPTQQKAVLRILYLDGLYGPNNAAIAISYTGHSIAIFTDMLGPRGPEGAALVHELGHQMGLVNGTSRQLAPHEDGVHALHDLNPSCVMFFSLDPRGDSVAPNDYCDKCKADLKAAGGK